MLETPLLFRNLLIQKVVHKEPWVMADIGGERSAKRSFVQCSHSHGTEFGLQQLVPPLPCTCRSILRVSTGEIAILQSAANADAMAVISHGDTRPSRSSSA